MEKCSYGLVELMVYIVLFILFFTVIIAEARNMSNMNHASNFILDVYLNKQVRPQLRSKTTVDDVLNLFLSEEESTIGMVCNSCVWRQSITIAFLVGIITSFIIKVVYAIPFHVFIVLFLSLFTFLFLLLSLVNFHYYGQKIELYEECLDKIGELLKKKQNKDFNE
jgi:thiosulfate reductase cytochrome b subunit